MVCVVFVFCLETNIKATIARNLSRKLCAYNKLHLHTGFTYSNPQIDVTHQARRLSDGQASSQHWMAGCRGCTFLFDHFWVTWTPWNLHSLKLTANAPENMFLAPKGKEIVFQPSIFRCKLLVSGRGGHCLYIIWMFCCFLVHYHSDPLHSSWHAALAQTISDPLYTPRFRKKKQWRPLESQS